MPHLARGQENNSNILSLHAVAASGHLYDPVTVEFRIVDLTTDLQVFPAVGLEDITVEGRVSQGVFEAFDTLLDVGWTPELAATVGPHRVDWTFTAVDGVTVQTWSLVFDVSEVGTGIPYWTYVSPNAIRAEGIDAAELSDERLVKLIVRVQAHIERETRQPFRPISITLRLDGSSTALLPLAVPIIGVETLKVNHSTLVFDPSGYRVYFVSALGNDPGWAPKDNRRNPKIVMAAEFTTSPFNAGGIFTGSRGVARFEPGAQPHELVGTFGFLERDGTTPILIEAAALQLVLANIPLLEAGAGGGSGPGGPVVRERTDRHEVEFAKPGSGASLSSSLNSSPEVEGILHRYRAPIGMASPATRWDTVRF